MGKQQKIYRHGKQREAKDRGATDPGNNGFAPRWTNYVSESKGSAPRIWDPIEHIPAREATGSNGSGRATDLGPDRPLAGPGNIGKQRIGKQRTGATDRPNRPLTGPGSNRKQRIGKRRKRIRDHLLGREATGSNGKPGIGKLDHLPAREATEATDRETTDPDHGFGI